MFNIKKKITKEVNHKIDNVNDRLVDVEDELEGYEQILNDVFDNFRKITKRQELDREMVLDLVFALASATKVKPATLSRNIDEEKLSNYAKLFDKAQVEKQSKVIEIAMQKAKKANKNLDKKAK